MSLNKKTSIFFKIPWFAARHAFLACLAIFFIAVILGGLVFHRNYYILRKGGVFEGKRYFDQSSYQQLVSYWEKSEARFKESDLKTYPNPFFLTKEKK